MNSLREAILQAIAALEGVERHVTYEDRFAAADALRAELYKLSKEQHIKETGE